MPVRLLIVDDEPHIRKVMRLALETSDYEVTEAATGEEALDLMTAPAKWDVVLLDERLPGIDGLETLKQLRAHDADAIVIMVTAFASIELAVEAMKLGATDFIRKPMSPDTLRGAVEAALAKARGEWRPEASTPADPAKERPFEVWVTNGFRLVHRADGASAAEQRFAVIRREPRFERENHRAFHAGRCGWSLGGGRAIARQRSPLLATPGRTRADSPCVEPCGRAAGWSVDRWRVDARRAQGSTEGGGLRTGRAGLVLDAEPGRA